MRLCVPIPCFFPCSTTEQFITAIRKSAELGYHTVETYDWRMLNTSAVRSTLADTGVELCSILVMENRLTTPESRDLWLTALKDTCEAAVGMGVRHAITQVGDDTGTSREAQHAAIVETLKAAKPILEYYGVTVMPEPLNIKVNHPGYYLTTAAEAFDIIREVDSPFVKVVYDIYHQQVTEGDIIPTVTQNLDLIAHLHAAGHPGRHELWEGELNYRYIFDAIDRAGYTGACGLEYNPLGDPVDSLKRSMEIYG
ncbi:MAG: TIM barrel protein [Clostridia bacterium]|nr:TIM barrel protein [Clostridia bacterium]